MDIKESEILLSQSSIIIEGLPTKIDKFEENIIQVFSQKTEMISTILIVNLGLGFLVLILVIVILTVISRK